MISGTASVFPCSTLNEPGATSDCPVSRLAVLWTRLLRYLLNTAWVTIQCQIDSVFSECLNKH